MTDDVLIRPVGAGDWGAIVAMESAAYAELGLSEGLDALRSRARVSPGTCFVVEADDRIAGYLLALPYPADRYPDLRESETTAFSSPNLHLHDLVVSSPFRGRSLARRLLDHLVATARNLGFEELSLVAVGDSRAFWSYQGFTVRPEVVTTGYDPLAVYMSLALAAPTPRSSPPTESD